MKLDHIYFIVDHTQTAQNIGMAARAMANFGFSRIRLVDPKFMDRAKRVARYGHMVVEKAERFNGLEEAIADLGLVLGTTGNPSLQGEECLSPAQAAEELAGFSTKAKVGLLFGPESRGLTRAQLALCDRISSVPTDQECVSTNHPPSTLINPP